MREMGTLSRPRLKVLFAGSDLAPPSPASPTSSPPAPCSSCPDGPLTKERLPTTAPWASALDHKAGWPSTKPKTRSEGKGKGRRGGPTVTGRARVSRCPSRGQGMPPSALLMATRVYCVYWKAEFPPKGGVEGTARKHLAEHQETGWQAPPFSECITPSPHTGAPGNTSPRGAWPSLPAHSPQTTSSKSGSATLLDEQKGLPSPRGERSLSLPSSGQSEWHGVQAERALVRRTRASLHLPMSFPSPKEVKGLAFTRQGGSLTPVPQPGPKETTSQVLGPLVTSSFFV